MTEPENSSIRQSKVEEQRMRQNLVMIERPMKAGQCIHCIPRELRFAVHQNAEARAT